MQTPTEYDSPATVEAWRAAATTSEEQRRLWRDMLRVRKFEKRAYDLFLQNLIAGTSHLAIGQEGIAAGFALAMAPDDYSFATYRGHAHTLLRGAPMAPLLAELMGRANGILGGKGGSMHLTSVEHGAMGSYAIVGAHLPIALGAGWSAQYRESGQVSVCFFGDGTTNIGAFHESLNLAAVWKLPVVFVCENNHYMEYTKTSTVTAVKYPAADRARSYGLDPWIVDGNNVEDVYAAARKALDRARAGGGPSLIEALTYRHHGHSRADPAKYRDKAEVETWMLRDPIPAYRRVLLARGVLTDDLDRIDADVVAEVDAAEAEARSGPPPSASIVETELWADGGSSWRN